jgi:hypothetical protein
MDRAAMSRRSSSIVNLKTFITLPYPYPRIGSGRRRALENASHCVVPLPYTKMLRKEANGCKIVLVE